VAARETLVFCGSAELTMLTDIFWGTMFLRNSGLGSLIDSEHGTGENRMHYLLALCEYQLKWTLHGPDLRWSLISTTRLCLASDLRDKIFAVIGLFRDFGREFSLSKTASESNIAKGIDIPSRSIDQEAIRSLWTSPNPRIRELHRLISDLLDLHAVVLTAILKKDKINDVDLQQYHESQGVIALNVFQHLVHQIVLTREWK